MIPLIGDSRFSKPVRVVRLLLERNEEGLSLTLRSDADGAEVELRFVGVSQLRFRGATTGLLGLVLLQYEDIASQGWEDIRFRVTDYEEEFVSFYCADIKVTLVKGEDLM